MKQNIHSINRTIMRRVLTIMAAVAFCMLTHAADYKYLVIETNDGTAYSLTAIGQTITFPNGNLVSSDGTTIPLTALSKMYFSETSGISEMNSTSAAEGSVTVYTTTGALIGMFDNAAAAKNTLRKGVYVMKSSNGVSTKMAVK